MVYYNDDHFLNIVIDLDSDLIAQNKTKHRFPYE
jgi:hypothetical protein